jgi:hypothetical protein
VKRIREEKRGGGERVGKSASKKVSQMCDHNIRRVNMRMKTCVKITQ